MARIIIIGTAYPYRGGIAAFNERLAREYLREGDTVEIETFRMQYPGFLFPGKTQYADWDAPEGLTIRRTLNSISPVNWIRTGLRIKKQRYDLVIFKFWIPFMGPCFGTIARIIRRNNHSKTIAVLDNIIPHEKRVGDTILTRYFVRSIDGFIAMSKSVLDDLSRFNKTKPQLYSPHPIYDNYGSSMSKSESRRLLGLEDKCNYVLFFGLVREYKGLDLLIEAFSDPRIKEMPIKAVVAGEFYVDSKKYLDLIESKGVKEKFIIRDQFIPDGDVSKWFCACDLMVQPYKTATQSGVTQIGYFFDKPMLVTNVGGLPEIIPHMKCGYVVPPDHAEIADAIVDYYMNNREPEFVKGVKEEKKRFSWDKMLKNIALLLNEEDRV